MQFVDEVVIALQSGHGGAGAVSFRREKYVDKGGPDGGDGGKGGDVVLQAAGSLQTLMDLKLKKQVHAPNGRPGLGRKKHGPDGTNIVIRVPVGTMVFSTENDGDLIVDLTENGQEFVIAKGGKGGKGNVHFARASHQTPRYAQPGLPGESLSVKLEVRMIAEVGLVGLPNAGKSTLLKRLTRANAKIGDYPFTTLYPNLGVLKTNDREIVLADVPGLIEGASEGHGLGDAFLRHVNRCKALVHLVAVNLQGPEATFRDYEVIVSELEKHGKGLETKTPILVLSQSDLLPADDLNLYLELFREKGIGIFGISSHSGIGMDKLIEVLLDI